MKLMLRTAVLALVLGAATAASAALVRHAGEWETKINGNTMGGPVCFPKDAVFDRETVMHQMARIPSAKCDSPDITTIGPVVTFRMQCDVYGNHMVTSGTVTQTGPDSFMTKAHTHVDGGVMKLPNGQSMPMPDQDMTTASQRIGACKPGDRMMKED